MPAAKYSQIDIMSTNKSVGHYANYLDPGYQYGSSSVNSRWEPQQEYSDLPCANESFLTTPDMKSWVHQQHDFTMDHHSYPGPGANVQKFSSSHSFRSGQTFYDDNGQLLENSNNNSFPYFSALHSQPNCREPVSVQRNVASIYQSNNDSVYENYPFCSSFDSSSSNYTSRVCCRSGVDQSALNCEYLNNAQKVNTDLISHTHSGQRTGSRVCTEQPKSTRDHMSQLDQAIEHCRQATSQQLVATRQTCSSGAVGDDLYLDHVPDRDYPADYKQYVGDRNMQPRATEKTHKLNHRAIVGEFGRNDSFYRLNCTEMSEEMIPQSEQVDSYDMRVRESVSSDPEIYTKNSSVAKLNLQIHRLREEMLALRSTTLTYKQHMEKMFKDLKAISRMYDLGRYPWQNTQNSDGSTNHFTIYGTPESRSVPSRGLHAQSGNNNFIAGSTNDACEIVGADVTKCSFPEKSSRSAERLEVDLQRSKTDSTRTDAPPSYENFIDSKYSSHSYVKPRIEGEGLISKRTKVSERPNSDPFTSFQNTNEKFPANGEPPSSTMSLPHSQSSNKHASKTGKTTAKSELNRMKSYNEQLRILPVLSKSNAALHISECSIDSGYQGSFVTSPREKHGRELASQVVTPASPINETPTQKGIAGDVDCKNDQSVANGRSGSFSESTAELSSCQRNKYESLDVAAEIVDNVSDVFVNEQEQSDHKYEFQCQSPTIVPLKSHDGPSVDTSSSGKPFSDVAPKPRLSRSSTMSESSEDGKKLERPVPKQRTVFNAAKLPSTKLIEKSVVSSSISEESSHQETLLLEQTNISNDYTENATNPENKSILSSDKSICNINMRSVVTRPAPAHCLTVIKPLAPTATDTAIPAQNRVKLGVSAIKQLTPSSEKEGSIFYCTGQVVRNNEANPRIRKVPNTKQLLREKFAAVVEHSSAANKVGECADDGDIESSVVRRRSMRMMTEFQIFDFKESLADLNTLTPSDPVATKPLCDKPSNPKQISSTVSNLVAEETRCSSYSVSPSAATVSKQIFDVEKNQTKPKTIAALNFKPESRQFQENIKNNFTVTTSKTNNYENSRVCSETSIPPPVPPRSPPMVEDKPPSLTASQVSLFSEVELVPQQPTKRPTALYLTPLIRPKASLPGVSCDLVTPEGLQKASLNGLKIAPSTKSAFTPVMMTKPSPLIERHDVPFRSAHALDGVNKCEVKRRVSLPEGVISNKQRFLNEFMPNALKNDNNNITPTYEGDQLSEFHRRSSLRTRRTNKEVVDSLLSNERRIIQTNNTDIEEAKTSKKQAYPTTELLFSEIPKRSTSQDDREHIHVTANKSRSNSSSNNCHDLENQPIRYSRSEKLTDVVESLRTAGYLRNSDPPKTTNKVSVSSTSSLGSNRRHAKENSHNPPPAHQPRSSSAENKCSSFRKTRSSNTLHQYEIVKETDTHRINSSQTNAQGSSTSKSKALHVDVEAIEKAQSPTRAHKSTVAMLKASLMGKRDKPPRSATTEGKRDSSSKNELKSRSASVGVKKKNDATTNAKNSGKSKNNENKNKISNSEVKKSKNDSKFLKEKSSKKNGKESSSKTTGKKNGKDNTFDASPEFEAVPVLPDSGPRKHGDADAEVMERFLAAAAASHSPRSPLQRLRNSFRVPKNKTRLLNAARIKDDIEVTNYHQRPDSRFHNDKNNPLRQEFTYV